MIYHQSGPLRGQVSVDNGTDLPHTVREGFRAQKRLLDRMNDPAFREAVRLAAKADPVLNGQETALERQYRHQIQPTTTDKGIIEGHNAASRIIGVKSAIIH